MTVTCPPDCIKNTPLWSLYDITDTNPEFCLYNSIVSEFTDVAGFEIMYYRAKSKLDRLYGEDANQTYYDPVKTKLYYEPSDEPNIIDTFGIRSDETLEYTLIPKSNFTRDVGGTITGIPLTISGAIGGTSYTTKDMISTTGGSGTELYVDIVTGSGSITKITINSFNKGSGYVVGDVINIVGGDNNATFEIASITTSDIGPMAGDVIKTLWNNRNFEVVDIGAEQSIFQGKKLVWEFILRPYRFSEQSLAAEKIHRSVVDWTNIYIHPDGLLADVTYSDGTEITDVDVTELDIDMSVLECGSTYKKNVDGSYDLVISEIVVEDDIFPHPTYEETGKPFEDKLETIYGDNSLIESESNIIDDYNDIDDIMFTYSSSLPVMYGTSSVTVLTQSEVNGFSSIKVLDGETYELQFSAVDSYIYIVIPVEFNNVVFLVNGLLVSFEETTDNFLFDGGSYTTKVYKSQYLVNGDIVVNMTPEE